MPKINSKILFIVFAFFVFLFLIFFVSTSIYIGSHVNEYCNIAKDKYQESVCTNALIKTLQSENESFFDRNNAIWSLGQIGSRESLDELKQYFTNNIPPKGSYHNTLSQYELKKAINLIEKQNNLAGLVWKRFYKIK